MTASRSHFAVRLLTGLALGGLTCVLPIAASGPYLTEPGFWWNYRPGIEPQAFAAGEPVILLETFDPVFLHSAYRRLSGLDPLTMETFDDLLGLAEDGTFRSNGRDRPSAAISRWRETREAIDPKTVRRPYPWVFRERPSPQDSEAVDYLSFLNCHADAFDTAAETLKARIAEHGAASAIVSRWLAAQDRVFAACAEREPPPTPAIDERPPVFHLPPDAGAQEIHDRAYQEAAEHFYLGRYEEAAQAFTLISRDASSPWRPIAALLVGRSHIRRATVGTGVDPLEAFARALVALDDVLARPEFGELHASAERLRQFVLLRTDPIGSARRLEAALLADDPAAADRQALIDLSWLVSKWNLADAETTSNDFGLWLRCLRSVESQPDEALRVATQRWREIRENGSDALPWLIATGLIASSAEMDLGPWSLPGELALAEEWLKATEVFDRVDLTALDAAEAWALPTLLYLRARIAAQLERSESLHATLDQAEVVFADQLSTGDANRFAALRAVRARDLDEFLTAAQQIPVTEVFNPDSRHGEWAISGSAERLLIPSATRIIDQWLPLDMQTEIVTGDRRELLSPLVRDAFERAAWARAAALDRGAPAIDLAQAAAHGSDSADSDFGRFSSHYLEIEGAEARRIARLLSIIERPWSTPSVGAAQARADRIGERDSFRRNWWCPFDADDASDPSERPPFVTKAQAERGLDEEETLTAIGPGQIAIGWELIEWADRDRDDPRVPEALHRIVLATRYAQCTATDANETLSRAAFKRLHERYPDSEWTEATPYWYR